MLGAPGRELVMICGRREEGARYLGTTRTFGFHYQTREEPLNKREKAAFEAAMTLTRTFFERVERARAS